LTTNSIETTLTSTIINKDENISLERLATTSSSSSGQLKTLLIKKEKHHLTNENHQFKPINGKLNNDLPFNADNLNQQNEDEVYENDEDEEEDEEEEEMIDSSSNNQLKIQMPFTATPSSSSSCPSPVNTNTTTTNNNNYEPINTADIAQKVRDLLSVHNIGQRVFAKFILGLSQGTVSELLSKPKHWDKLTEKGRESYRKMFSWSCSEQSINKLKSISPRKGNKDNYFYHQTINNNNNNNTALPIITPTTTSISKEDPATEQRIAQILNEAQKQMKAANGIKLNGERMRLQNVCYFLFFIELTFKLLIFFCFIGCMFITITIWVIIS
jgi:hypothetical protein